MEKKEESFTEERIRWSNTYSGAESDEEKCLQ